MKYERFEDLPVWKAAIDLARRVYVLTRDRFFSQPGDLCDQLRRAALSVSNNIAEGFERGSTAELLMFLYIARGSAGEVRSILTDLHRLNCAKADNFFASESVNRSSFRNDFSSQIFLTRNRLSFRSAFASSRPTSCSSHRIGNEKYPKLRFAAGT